MNTKPFFCLLMLVIAAVLAGCFGAGDVPDEFDVFDWRQEEVVTVVYEAATAEPSDEDMQAALRILRRRFSDAELLGTRHFRVTFPGPADGDIEQRAVSLSQKGLLTFRDEEGNILLTGADVDYAGIGVDSGQILVNLSFTSAGTQAFADATRANLGRTILIFMDEELISAPVVNTVIPDGMAIITGPGQFGFSRREADDLVNTILYGALPFDLYVVSIE